MDKQAFYTQLTQQLDALRTQGLFKEERALTSPQDSTITLTNNLPLVNLCANNYLGSGQSPQGARSSTCRIRAIRLWHGIGALYLRYTIDSSDT